MDSTTFKLLEERAKLYAEACGISAQLERLRNGIVLHVSASRAGRHWAGAFQIDIYDVKLFCPFTLLRLRWLNAMQELAEKQVDEVDSMTKVPA